jgi:hypothetical protein
MLFSADNTHTYKHIDNSGLHSKSEFLGWYLCVRAGSGLSV